MTSAPTNTSRTRLSSWLAAATLLLVVLLPAAVAANAAAPLTYQTEVDTNEVTVCPWNFDGRGCANGDVLVRENTETGETVVVAENCTSGDTCQGDDCCYFDSCVDEGAYRYGFADAYTCNEASSGVYFYSEATVDTEAADCQPNSTQRYDKGVPWKDKDRTICTYMNPGSDAGADSGNAGPDGGAGGATEPDDEGCSLAGGSLGAGTVVFLLNGVFFLLGLALLRRRD